MNITCFETSFFPFAAPEKDASVVGAGTVYPAGLSLDQAVQLYWRAQDFRLVASGDGVLGGITQTLAANALVPRNMAIGTNAFSTLSGFSPTGPWDLVSGRGVRQTVPGSGTVTASGDFGTGTNSAARLNALVYLFVPQTGAPDPVVRYDGLWWPAMSLTCSVTNTVEVDDGELEIAFDACTVPTAGTPTVIGLFSFFGVTSVPVYCSPLAPPSGPDPAETRTFSGSLAVEAEWP